MRRARLELLAESAAQPGFVRAAARLRGRARAARWSSRPASPRRCGRGPATARGARYAEEVAAIYRGYRDGLEAAGLADPELFAWRALDALRREPAGWGATPRVRLRLRRLHAAPARRARDARRAAAARTWSRLAAVTSPGARRSRPSRPRTRSCSRGRGREHALAPLDDHYAAESRAAAAPRRAQPVRGRRSTARRGRRRDRVPLRRRPARRGRAGRRAPARAAARRRRAGRHRRGAAPPRRLRLAARAGVRRLRHPVLDRPLACRSGHTGLGRGLLALVRCAAAADGDGRRPARLAAHAGPARQPGAGRPARGGGAPRGRAQRRARRAQLWERERWQLDELDRLRRARAARRLPGRARAPARAACSPRPTAAGAAILQRARARRPARVRGGARGARASCAPSLEADPRTRLDPERVLAVLRELRVRLGEPPQPDRVQVAEPEAIRARRFEAVFVCGLQEGEFPRARRPSRSCPTRTAARSPTRERPAAAGARGPARPRALPLLRLLLARRAPAGAVVALERRGGQPAAAVVLRRGRARPARRGAAERTPLAVRRHLERPRTPPRPPSSSAALAAAGPRRAASRAAGRLTAEPLLERLAARDARLRRRARELRRLPGQVAGGGPAAARRAGARPRADGARPLRPRRAQRTFARLREETGDRARHARPTSPRPSGSCSRSCASQQLRVPALAEADAREGRRAPARVRPAALPAPRGRARRQLRARAPRAAVRRRRGQRAGRARAGRDGARADRPRGH